MMERADIGVVVLNWNNAPDSLDCLRSLARSNEPVDAIVVDNGSVDGSADLIESSGLATRLIRTGANLGFAGGNNVGLAYALETGYPCVVVLNNDTVVSATSMGRLRTHVMTGAPVAASPLITFADPPNEVWFAGGVIDKGWPRHLQVSETPPFTVPLQPSEILTGCCIAATSHTWNRVGGFDERFFLIFEDSDWSVRAQRQQVPLVVATDVVIRHKVSRSFQFGGMPALGTFYFVRNGLLFHWRYAKRHIPRFAWSWLIRPTARRVRGRATTTVVPFAWLGALAAVSRRFGKAPETVERLSQRWVR